MVVEFFKRPTAGHKLKQGQVDLIKIYIDDKDFGHDNLPWIIHPDGSRELTEYHKRALRLLRDIDRITEQERGEVAKEELQEKQENERLKQIKKTQQQGFIPRAKAKPRPQFGKTSRVIGNTKKSQQLAAKYKGDYMKFRKEMMEKMKTEQKKADDRKKRMKSGATH